MNFLLSRLHECYLAFVASHTCTVVNSIQRACGSQTLQNVRPLINLHLSGVLQFMIDCTHE